jgi:hypothetical protein
LATPPSDQPPSDQPPKRSFSLLHSPVLAGVLAVVAGGVGVWAAVTQVSSGQRGDENETLRNSIASLQRRNGDLATENATLKSEVDALRRPPTPAPTGTAPSTVAAPTAPATDDPTTWRVPANLLGNWTGVTVNSAGTIRVTVSITIDGRGVGKGGQVGSTKAVAQDGDCLQSLFLTELRVDGSIVVDPDKASGNCYNLGYLYTLTVRPDGRLGIVANFGTGALTKAR